MVMRFRRCRRVASILALVYVVYALLVVFVVGPVARRQAEIQLGKQLKRRVVVAGVRVNPFTLRLQVRGVEIWEPDGKRLFAGLERLEANVDPLSCVWHRGIVVNGIVVEGLRATVIRHRDGSLNLSDLLKPKPKPEPSPGPPRFSISDIRVQNCWFVFRDEQVGAEQRLTGMEFSLASVSSLPRRVKESVLPAFRARLNGRELALDADAKPFAELAEGTVHFGLKGLDLTAFAAYLPEPRNFDLSSGLLDIDLAFNTWSEEEQGARNYLSGAVGLRELRLLGRDGRPMVGIDALRVELLPADLLRKQIHVASVSCTSPFLRLERDAQGVLILPRVEQPEAAPAPTEAAPADAPKEAGPSIDVDRISVQKGRVEFADATVQPAFESQLGFGVELTGVSTRPGHSVSAHVDVLTESDERVTAAYTATLLPQFSLAGNTTLKGLRLPKYMPYLQGTLAAAITRGTLDLSVDHTVDAAAGGTKVTDLDVSLADFCLVAGSDQTPVVTLQQLAVADVAIDPDARNAVVGALSTQDGVIHIQHFADGSLNLQKLVRAAKPPPPAEKPAPAAPAAAAPEQPWTLIMRKASMAAWNVVLDDMQPTAPVHMDVHDIALSVGDLGTLPGQKSTLSLALKLNKEAALDVSGEFGLRPVSADLAVTLDGLALSDFQHYVADRLNLVLADGTFGTDLKIDIAAAPGGMAGTVGGSVSLRSLAAAYADTSQDLVKCREFALRDIKVDLKPLAVHLGEVALGGFATDVTLEPDGQLNLLSVLPDAPAPTPVAAVQSAESPAPTGDSFPLDIGTIRLDDCDVVFTDQQVTPNFRLQLGELGGTVTDFSLGNPAPAQLDLSARLNGYSPLSLKATFADLGPQMTLSAATTLGGLDLTPVTPYSGRFAGYAVQKGKLSLDLKYTIEQRRLTAEHKVLIDQFSFGQKVDSPDATKLPVRLAVALLKDRKGQISFDVPVRGSLDDPKFSVLRIVLKVVRDLVAKAATAPFAMLGALVGGGEELSFVDFAPGNVGIDKAAAKKLDLLAKALYERPGLQLEIAGAVDLSTDRAALADEALLRQLRARKLAALTESGAPAVPIEEVTVTDAERNELLLAIYRDSLPKAPPESTAPSKALPKPAEVEQQLLAKITISDEQVRQLASQRAASVREFLAATDKVAPDRIFVVAADPKQATGARQARLALR